MSPFLIAGGAGTVLGLAVAGTIGYFLVSGAHAERDAALKAEKLATEDAIRWTAAASDRDKLIADLNEQLAKITRDAQDTQQAALELIDQAQDRADNTEKQLAKLRSQANAAKESDKPRPLSPAAKLGLEWLRCRAKDPANSSAC